MHDVSVKVMERTGMDLIGLHSEDGNQFLFSQDVVSHVGITNTKLGEKALKK